MKCKKCGADLPAHAKYCDICGTKILRETYEQRAARETQERAKAKKRRFIRRIVIAACVLILAVVAWNMFWVKDLYFEPDIYHKSNRVSAEEYANISEGLTYEQIKDELGKGYKDGVFGNAFWGYTSYVWPGEYIDKGLLYSEVNVFIDTKTKKCDHFSERNVIDGEEIYENLSKEKKAKTKKTKAEIEAAVKPGMSYEQVVAFLGVEGILKDSSSNSDGNLEKTYDWTYNDEYYDSDFTIYFDKGKVRDLYIY